MIQHKKARALLLVIPVLLLAACSATGGGSTSSPTPTATTDPAWAKIVAQADQEGAVTIYSSLSGFDARITTGFEKEYPQIKVTVVREATGDLVTKLDAEKNSSAAGADVAMVTSPSWFLANLSYVTPLKGDSAKLYAGTAFTGGDKQFFTDAANPYTWTYNTAVLKKVGAHAIKSWKDLLQPQLKGLIGINDPSSTPGTLEMLYQVNQTQGPAYVKELAAQQLRFSGTIGDLDQQVGAGDIAVALGGSALNADPLVEAGAPVESTPISKPDVTTAATMGIVKWATHPAAAQVLENWMLSRAGQESQHSWGVTSSILPNIPGSLSLKGRKIYDGIQTPALTKYLAQLRGIFNFS